MSLVYQGGRDSVGRVDLAMMPAAPPGWNETLERASEVGVELLERTAAGEIVEVGDRNSGVDACRGLPLPALHAPDSALRDLRLTQRLADLRREERARGHRLEGPPTEEGAFW